MRAFHLKHVALTLVLLSAFHAHSTQLLLSLGGGPQFGTDDTNFASAIDGIFYDIPRSSRQTLSFGASLTYASSNTLSSPSSFVAISFFPELRLNSTWRNKAVFFHVRALGPSYLKETRFGTREQAMHFAFQAQVGGGVYLDNAKKYQLRLQYRHFSNANLKQPNDGIDFPLMLSLGYNFY